MAYLQKMFINPFTRKSLKYLFKKPRHSSIPKFWWEGEKPFKAAFYPIDRIRIEALNIARPYQMKKNFYSDLAQPIKAIGNIFQACSFALYVLMRLGLTIGRIPFLFFSNEQRALFKNDFRDIAYYTLTALSTLTLSAFRLVMTPIKWFLYIPVRIILTVKEENKYFEEDERVFVHAKKAIELSNQLDKTHIKHLMRHLFALQNKLEKASDQKRLMMKNVAGKELLQLDLKKDYESASQKLWSLSQVLNVRPAAEPLACKNVQQEVNAYLKNYLSFFPPQKLNQLAETLPEVKPHFS